MSLHEQHQQQQRRSRRTYTPNTTTSSTTTTTSNKLQFLVLGAAEAGKTSIIRRYFHNQFDINRLPTLGSDYYTSNQTITIQKVPPVTSLSSKTSSSSCTGTSPSDNNDSHMNIDTTIDIDENDTTSSTGTSTSTAIQDESITANVTTKINLRVWDTPGRERYRVNSNTTSGSTNNNNRPSSLSESFFNNVDGILLVYDMTSSTSFQQLLKWYADIIHIYQRKNSSSSINNNTTNTTSSTNVTSQQHQHPPILICANKLDLFEQRFNNATTLSTVLHDKHRTTTTTTTTETTILTKGNTATTNRRNVFTFQRNFRGHDFQYEYQVCHDGINNITGNTKSLLTKTKPKQKNTTCNSKTVLKHFINKLGFIEPIQEEVITNTLSDVSNSCTTSTTVPISTTSSLSTTTPLSPASNSSSTSTSTGAPSPVSNSRSSTSSTPSSNNRQHNKQHMELLTYLANRESKWWTNNDYTYLESLVLSEDLSHPDRELVVLWCKRNYLYHSDVSAATGYGINSTFNQLIQLSIVYKQQQNVILYEQQKLEQERQKQQQQLLEQQQQYIMMQLAQHQQ